MNEYINRQLLTLVEGQVYLTLGGGHVTSELLHEFDQAVMAVIDASHATFVHLISDARQMLSLPSVNEIRKIKYPYHPRMGYTITVGALRNPLMHFTINLSLSITKMRYRDMKTLEEAYAFLAAKDPSLPPLHTWNIPSHVDAVALWVKRITDACLLVSGLHIVDVRRLRQEQQVVVQDMGLISSIRFSLDEIDTLDDPMFFDILVTRLKGFKADVDRAFPQV